MHRPLEASCFLSRALRSLSVAQTSIWFAQALDPESLALNLGQYLEIFGQVDPPLFEAAMRRVMSATDAFNVHCVETDVGPQQYFSPDPNGVIRVLDFSGEPDPRAAVHDWMHDDMSRAINIERGPTFTLALLQCTPDGFFYYQRVHHIVADGASGLLLAQRVAASYSALVTDEPADAVDYGSLLHLLDEEEVYRSSVQYERDRQYRQTRFSTRPATVTLSGKAQKRSRDFIHCTQDISAELVICLRTLARQYGASLPQLITATAAAYLKPAHKCVEGGRALKHPAQCGVDANQSRRPRRTAQDN